MRRYEEETFPVRLRRLRETRRLKRCVLSELCGLNRNQIARYERGESAPTMDSLSALADFFEVSVDYLICRTHTPVDRR